MAWLAHYGVPKSQWSDEARRRYDAQHRGGKTLPWGVAIRNLKTGYDAYQDAQRSTQEPRRLSNKVDEQRIRNASNERSRTSGNSTRGSGNDRSGHRNNGQHVSQYRKPSSQSPSLRSDRKAPTRVDNGQHVQRQGKPQSNTSSGPEWRGGTRNQATSGKPSSHVRNGATGGKNASRRSKNTPSTQSADAAISRNMRSGKNSYNPTDDYRNQSQAARGRQQIERASNIITGNTSDRGALRNYYHNGNFIKRNEQTDAYLRELGIDPNSNRLVATPKRPENRVNSGTVTNARNRNTVNHRTDNPIARAAKEAQEAEILRKNAENRKNRSTRRTSKTWNNKSSQSRKPASSTSRQYRQYGWENPSSYRDAVEYDRRVAQINRGSNRGYTSHDFYRPTTATDEASIRRRRRRR